MFNQSEIETANKTSRANGAIGANAIVPKFVLKHLELFFDKKDAKILDFGAGKQALHTRALRAKGWDCVAYEFGDNATEYHSKDVLFDRFDIVFASNVLNVQSSGAMAYRTIKQLASVVTSPYNDGKVFVNYPSSPRKSNLTTGDMKEMLLKHFREVSWVGGSRNAPIWTCMK